MTDEGIYERSGEGIKREASSYSGFGLRSLYQKIIRLIKNS